MTATATSILNAARAEIGTHESPPGTNRTEFGVAFGWNGVSWCDQFVSVIADRVNARSIVGHFAYTPSHAAWFMSRGQWHTWRETPRRGDILFFDWTGQHHASAPARESDPSSPGIRHVGFCTGFDAQYDVALTVEGNTRSGVTGNQSDGDGVYARRRNRLYLAGFGRPAYAAEGSVRALPSAVSRGYDRRPLPLLVDGIWGRATTIRVQQWLNVTPDGGYGPVTKKALQHAVGVPADGVIGPQTVRALQRKVGATVDGELGRGTVRALQRYLNRAL